jgi:hypothetical protein
MEIGICVYWKEQLAGISEPPLNHVAEDAQAVGERVDTYALRLQPFASLEHDLGEFLSKALCRGLLDARDAKTHGHDHLPRLLCRFLHHKHAHHLRRH